MAETGFYRRAPRAIEAFPFALCCALAAVLEGKRGFASVWRLLAAAAGIQVARSAVTQRFDDESAAFLEALFLLAVSRLPSAEIPELLSRLEQSRAVLGEDATVLQLSPLLGKLFPATRTKTMGAAGKLHVRADLVQRQILGVVVTGERQSDLGVARSQPIERGTLYMRDLGYMDYDELARIVEQGGEFLMRLKEGAAPRIVKVRHGLRNGADLVRRGVRWNEVTEIEAATSRTTIDFDAAFPTKSHGEIVLRVVGVLNPETDTYHFYVTSLDPAEFSPEEIRTLYALRWQIELLMKLLRSSCHLDHLDTSDLGALRTHIYASLLAAVILSAVVVATAAARGLPAGAISPLMVGIAAPLFGLPLLWLWLGREPTPEEIADSLLGMIAVGCRDQNPNRTRDKWGCLARD